MFFKDITGQEEIKAKLINTALNEKISHAQLFLGSEGYGNLGMAIAYARYISCSDRGEHDACGKCSSCNKYNKLVHPDLHFVFPVNAGKKELKNPVSDDYIFEWRECILQNPYITESQWYEFIGIENKQGFIGTGESQQIIRKLNLKPYESEYKIMIIWLPEKMNQAAANKLLKMIEEPPDNTVFIMVSASVQNMLPTVLSRLQLIKFPKIRDEDLKQTLSEKFSLSEKQLADIVHLSDGNFQKALDFLNSDSENIFFLEKFASLMRIAYKKNVPSLIRLVDELHGLGREKLKRFVIYSLGLIRENLALNFELENMVYLSSEEFDFSGKFHSYVHSSNVEKIYHLLNDAYRDIEANAYSRIVFLDVGLHLFELMKKETEFGHLKT